MGRLKFADRQMIFGRAQNNPNADAAVPAADGALVIPACDPAGILWTRSSTGGQGINNTVPGGKTAWRDAFSAPAAGALATASIAGIVGAQWVVTHIVAGLTDTAAAVVRNVLVRDGASGVGTIIARFQIGALLAGTNQQLVIPNVQILMPTANNTVTVEFDAAGAATTTELINFQAYPAT